MKRADVVWLAKTEAQCKPSGYCARKENCARYLVQHVQGRPVTDYSVQAITSGIYGTSYCPGWMDASKHRQPPAGQGGGRVHEAPKGLL